MNIAILGYGKEGQAVESYFKSETNAIKVFDNFSDDELRNLDLSSYDMVFRSPSVKPLDQSWNSITKYFFDNCICNIIGVTGTKGKGTTCSLISSILTALGKTVHLVGNIGLPAIEILDQIQPDDIVVYEMSSFQLWDLTVSPRVAVILGIEPDHLNVHKDFTEYTSAKSNIVKFQSPDDYCIYNIYNQFSSQIAELSPAHKLPYPNTNNRPHNLDPLLDSLYIPGKHNRENAEAALLAAAAILGQTFDDAFITNNFAQLKLGLNNFHGLPHRLEFLREFNHVKYYDDNFSTNIASTKVAIDAFPDKNLVLIIGGRDKTEYKDLPEISQVITNSTNVKKVVLLGESGHELFNKYNNDKFILAESLEDAVNLAKNEAEQLPDAIVLMSPSAASFDMFNNVYDRGQQFTNLVNSLK